MVPSDLKISLIYLLKMKKKIFYGKICKNRDLLHIYYHKFILHFYISECFSTKYRRKYFSFHFNNFLNIGIYRNFYRSILKVYIINTFLFLLGT